MRFHAEHRFPGPVGAVLDVLAEPSFHRELELPELELLEVVDHGDDGNQASIVLRYEYVGHLDPVVQRLLGRRRLTWRQVLVLDREARAGRLDFEVEANPERLRGVVDFDFHEDGGETVRRLEGEVSVRVAVIGGTAERRIVPGFLRRLDIEAQHLTERLSS